MKHQTADHFRFSINPGCSLYSFYDYSLGTLPTQTFNNFIKRKGVMKMKNRSLIVYYSWVGNTEVVAKEIHRLTKFDIQKIEEKKTRKLGKVAGAAMGAVFGLKSSLKPMDFAMEGYENIFLGVQVWAGKTAPAVNKFLKEASFEDKKVWLFITKADEKIPQQVIDSITQRIEKKGGSVFDSMAITTKWDPKTNIPIEPEDVQEATHEWLQKEGFLEE
ncbi:MAG: hypothetical protein EA344_11695 [Alkalicoccus sp.]|nr:MAG: hypothetical protein EA344_11695 [Alkalicoccus sp.]